VAIGVVVAIVVGLAACVPPPPPGATLADTFTRAAAELGTAETGQPWVPVTGTWAVVDNRVVATSPGDSLVVADAGGSRGRLQVTVASLSTSFWMAFWVDGPQDLWRFGRSGDGSYGLEQVSDGVATRFPEQATITPDVGDRLVCDYDPISVRCSVDDAAVTTVSLVTGEGAEPRPTPGPATGPTTTIGLAATDPDVAPTVTFDDISFTPSVGSPNLVVAVTSAPSVEVGQASTVEVSVSNDGDAAATPVVLTTVLPDRVTHVSTDTTQGTCTAVGGTVSCDLGPLGPGAAAVVTTTVLATGSGAATATFLADVHIGDASGPPRARATSVTTIVQVGPVIDVWYGPVQPSGSPGTPQRWVDVLGTVHGDAPIVSVAYSLNGGPLLPLQVGPTGRRLAHPGDFVVQLAVPDLVVGDNVVTIVATDGQQRTRKTTVTVTHRTDAIWPLPTTVDWSATTSPIELARVVDGDWRIDGGQLRTARPGYDRIVTLGDGQWRDIEVTVPVTVHSVNLSAPPTSGFPLIGLFLRWNGHNATVTPGSQPQQGWLPDGNEPTPFGAATIVRWKAATSTPMQLWNHRAKVAKESARPLELGTTYLFKADVTTLSAATTRYRFKLWPAGEPEPAAWTQQYNAGVTDFQPAGGSVALVAHEADVSFGTVTVRRPGP
jgi:uncharacterized repeat protein (TIGR01451 family)